MSSLLRDFWWSKIEDERSMYLTAKLGDIFRQKTSVGDYEVWG